MFKQKLKCASVCGSVQKHEQTYRKYRICARRNIAKYSETNENIYKMCENKITCVEKC